MSITDFYNKTKEVFNEFTYTVDGPDQLYDAIVPPAANYKRYLDKTLKDDCDGFHSVIYHILYNSGFTNCYLLTVNPLWDGGHCVLLVNTGKINGNWRVIDYTTIHNRFDTAKEAIEDYNKFYPTCYQCKHGGDYIFNGLIRFNYSENKFESVSIESLE